VRRLATVTMLLTATLPVWSADEPSATEPRAIEPAPAAPVPLSLKRAVQIAISLQGNPSIPMAAETVAQARAHVSEARSAFLPDIDGAATKQNAIQSLGALGFTTIKLPFGLKIPATVGPYDVTDIRATGFETFAFSSIRRFEAARSGLRAARSEQKNRDTVVAGLAAKTYMEALYTQASLEAVGADVRLAQAVLAQAEHQKDAGTGTAIEVTRARVQLANAQQRELVAGNERRKAQFELLRAIGMSMDTEAELTDKLSYIPLETVTLEQAKAKASQSREDFKAQRAREEAARLSASAVTWERAPSVTGFGNYGTTGENANTPLVPTRTFGITVRVPVFDGGQREARRGEAVSQYRLEQVRTRDLSEQIELELREALDSLNSAKGQMEVAQEGLALATNELAQARRRYDAGFANGIEVTDAQTRLERARENDVIALFNYNLARIDLGQAMGTVLDLIQ